MEENVEESGSDEEMALLPLARLVSGYYEASARRPPVLPRPPVPVVPRPFAEDDEALDDAGDARAVFPLSRESLRLDVDRRYPQRAASGTLRVGARRVHWVARIKRTAPMTWEGDVFYRDGDASLLPHQRVSIVVSSAAPLAPPTAKVTFSNGAPPRTRTFKFISRHFHRVEFEFDRVAGVTPVTVYATGSHPDRPASLPSENLSIERVFDRAGFGVSKSGGDSEIPISDAGGNGTWSDAEMHDAMQVHWSRFADKPQWALWVLFAGRHDSGAGLGGVMFDDIGPNHRQGTALFNDSFISSPPGGDSAPAAWIRRMRFWTAVHEMGHAFNLAHAWQKSLGTPWIPLQDEPEARSFMNYPFRTAGGVPEFFKSFEFRFSDDELLFLRHAPERFVQMGNEDWFSNHGFEDEVPRDPRFALTFEGIPTRRTYAFLEPVVLQLTLTNVSDEPQIVPEGLLTDGHGVTVIVTREGGPPRAVAPFVRACSRPRNHVLQPKHSISVRVFASAGTGAWHIAEPGRYSLEAVVELEHTRVATARTSIRVQRPRGADEEELAMDYFTDDVARALALEGTRSLTGAVDTLRALVGGHATHAATPYARMALAMPSARNYKLLSYDDAGPRIEVHAADAGAVVEQLAPMVAAAAGSRLSALDVGVARTAEAGTEARSATTGVEHLLRSLRARHISEDVLQEVREEILRRGG